MIREQLNPIETLKELKPERWGKMDLYANGRFCALGYLAFRAGIPLEALAGHFTLNITEEAVLRETYGLDDIDIADLTAINDSSHSLGEVIHRLARWLGRRLVRGAGA